MRILQSAGEDRHLGFQFLAICRNQIWFMNRHWPHDGHWWQNETSGKIQDGGDLDKICRANADRHADNDHCAVT